MNYEEIMELAKIAGDPQRRKNDSLENMIIKEIQYSIYKDKYEMTYIKRFIFRDNYIYQISIGGRPAICLSFKTKWKHSSILYPSTILQKR